MEVAFAALITAFGSVIIALITRGTKGAKEAGDEAVATAKAAEILARDATKLLEEIRTQTATNGSKKTLGELAELMYTDLQLTKRELSAHKESTNAHGVNIWERRPTDRR